jgi:hypothetical protein
MPMFWFKFVCIACRIGIERQAIALITNMTHQSISYIPTLGNADLSVRKRFSYLYEYKIIGLYCLLDWETRVKVDRNLLILASRTKKVAYNRVTYGISIDRPLE